MRKRACPATSRGDAEERIPPIWREPFQTPPARPRTALPGAQPVHQVLERGGDRRDTLRAAEVLHEHPVPTLLAWAPDDLIFRLRYAERLRDMIPGARLETIADSRAFVPEDQPGRLAELIAKFVAEAGVDRGAQAA